MRVFIYLPLLRCIIFTRVRFMDIAIDEKALWIAIFGVIVFFLLYRWRKSYQEPHLFYPDLPGLKKAATGWRLNWAELPRWLCYMALLFFAIAFINPRIITPRQGQEPHQTGSEPIQGIAIYLVLDQSGSMADSVLTYDAQGNRVQKPKIDILKEVTTAFVKGDKSHGLAGRPHDMLGIVALARSARVISPLTLDHQAILDKIAHLQVLKSPEEGGTVIGYAIFKTANMITATRHYAEEINSKKMPAYTIKSNVIILVTDGFQDPNLEDKNKPLRTMEVPEAAEYARQAGVKVYIIDIDPAIGGNEFEAVRTQMQHAAELTGGKYYLVEGGKGLDKIYSEIDKLEKSALPTLAETSQTLLKEQQPKYFKTYYLYPIFLSLAILALLNALLLGSTLLRRAP